LTRGPPTSRRQHLITSGRGCVNVPGGSCSTVDLLDAESAEKRGVGFGDGRGHVAVGVTIRRAVTSYDLPVLVDTTGLPPQGLTHSFFCEHANTINHVACVVHSINRAAVYGQVGCPVHHP